LKLQVVRRIKRDHSGQAKLLARTATDIRHQVPAGGFADQRDAAAVDLIFLRVRFDPTDRRFYVLGAGRPAVLRGQPIIDAEPGETGLSERREQRLDIGLLVAADEAAAVYQDARRKRSRPLWHRDVQRQADVAGLGELDVHPRDSD